MRWSEHESSLRLVPGTREPVAGQIRGERREPARNLIVALEMEALHQCGAIESFVRMIDEEIEQLSRRTVADGGVGPRDVRLVESRELAAPRRVRCWLLGWRRPASQCGKHLARDLAQDWQLALGARPRQVDIAETGRAKCGHAVDEGVH